MSQAPRQVLELVARFRENLSAYKSPHYNEAQLRKEFLDPFFKELGWDMENKEGYSEAYKEVIHEDAIKMGEGHKAPDYCFRIGGTRKFFVEAKKPSVDIKNDASPAFQLRRYAFTESLPLSILSDFEEFVVYDGRIRPNKHQNAEFARVLYIRYTEYETRWEEIANVFSREAVLKGRFDKYAESVKARRGSSVIDNDFLETIETWRLELAVNLALRNRNLTQRELNFAVQRIIDRIIFLRICEDRGIEIYGRLLALANGDRIYPRLGQLFEQADDRFNSGLFHFKREKGRQEPPDELTLGLSLDDKLLREILKGLYYPDSPYVFSRLPADVLGHVYEQFLGKVIRLTEGHRAKVEDKPEVKKAGGVYYTPTYIVDYIVRNTVGKLVEDKPPKQAAQLKILDPACGSGSFLLGAYEFLLNWHLEFYMKNEPDKLAKGSKPVLVRGAGGGWKLTIAERKRILLDNIYGVDIDAQAVETTKLSLLLKVLEGETQQSLQTVFRTFQERALPDLGKNIKRGNSLIGPDFYQQQQLALLDEEERYRINVFDWPAEFPQVFHAKTSTNELHETPAPADYPWAGEPLHGSYAHKKWKGEKAAPTPWPVESEWEGGFDAVIGNPPYDVMEKERGAASWPHEALADYARGKSEFSAALGGKLNLFRFFIVRSLNLIKTDGRYGMIVPMSLLADISCAEGRRNLILSTKQLELDCFPQKDNAKRRIFQKAKLSTVVVTAAKTKNSPQRTAAFEIRVYPWNSFEDSPRRCSLRYEALALLDAENLPVPLVSEEQWQLCQKLHHQTNVRPLGKVGDFEVNRGEINQTIYREFISDNARLSRLLKGVEVGRFAIRHQLKQGFREWFDERRFLATNKPKLMAKKRRIATQRITGVDERLRVVATIIEPPCYFADSTNSILVKDHSAHSAEYLLGLLNSRLFQWRFKLTSTNNNVGTNEINAMPFRQVDFSEKSDKSRHDQMVKLVGRMLGLQKELSAAKTPQERISLERQMAAADTQIDRLVYDLYGLTETEIQLVEGAS